jgi:aspartyl-tRNA(Asn)/glutamyl-tRNA(Gln) amidotransferase subunit A
MIRESAVEIAEAVRRGERSAVEMVEMALAAIEETDGPLNSWVCIDEGLARQAAEAVDAAVSRGEDPGPLAGVPFGVKDLENCAGFPTGHGSLVYHEGPPATDDSIHVARMRAAGAVPLGKTTAPEFGTLNLTRNKSTGVTRNPWNPDRTPGGSSGGTARRLRRARSPSAPRATAAGRSASRPRSAGSWASRPATVAIAHPGLSASQTSVVGILATTVGDAARHLDVVAGPDDRDRLSLPAPPVRYEVAIETFEVDGLTACLVERTWGSRSSIPRSTSCAGARRTPSPTRPGWPSTSAPRSWMTR